MSIETPIGKKDQYHFLFLMIIVSAAYLIATRNNNLQSADSICYIIIAENFHDTGKYISCDGNPLIVWPPLFPTILSWGVEHLHIYVKILNLVCLNAIILVWYILGSKVFPHKNFNKAFIIFFSLSTPLMLISTFIWTELIFLLLLSVYLYIIYVYIKTPKNGYLVAATIISILILMQRNVGVFMLTAITIAVFLFGGLNGKEKVKILIQYFIPLTGSLIWNIERFWIRNDISIFNELFPQLTIMRNMRLVLGDFGRNIAPGSFEFIGIALATIPVIAAVFFLLNRKENTFIRILCFLFLFYVGFWFLVPGDIYEITRYLSVIIPVFYLLIFYGLNLLRERGYKYRIVFGAVGLTVWGLYTILRLLKNVALWGQIDFQLFSFFSDISIQ